MGVTAPCHLRHPFSLEQKRAMKKLLFLTVFLVLVGTSSAFSDARKSPGKCIMIMVSRRFIPLSPILVLIFFLWTGSGLLHAADDPLIDVTAVIPDAIIDVRYATAGNFLKKPVYPVAAVFLKKSVAEKLRKAADDLRGQGYRLKIFDGYRPLSVQKLMWEIMPDRRYVANPKSGSMHNRGGAVDLTMLTLDGKEVEMPSAYDDFSPRAHHNNMISPPAAIENANRLKAAMEKAGLKSITSEWWHYSDPGIASMPVMDIPLETLVNQKIEEDTQPERPPSPVP